MGKVKDESATPRASKPEAKSGRPKVGRRSSQFLATMTSRALYKPMQGWHARLWTGLAIGAVLLIGVWRLFDALEGSADIYVQYGLCVTLAAAFAWLAFRIVHYPQFADFLIATQAEMNKVSWISRDDLKRATAVVLVTVVLLSVFLFGIDQVWMRLLDFIGVLQVSSEGLGSSS